MLEAILPSLISAGSSLLGGVMNKNSSAKTARLQMMQAAEDRAMQKEFAQNGIRWKAADAKAAGIHPLAALGAQTTSFSPVQVGLQADHSMGNAVSSMGQDISRALQATRSESQRTDAFTKSVQDLTLQKMGLENQVLASQVAKANQPATPPPFPTITGLSKAANASKGDPAVNTKAMEREHANPGNPTQSPAPITDVSFSTTPKGFFPVMSKDAKDRLEEDWPGMIMWNMRNRVMPSFSQRYHNPPQEDPGKGREWYWSPFHFEYRNRKSVPASEVKRSLFRRSSN